MEQRQKKKLNFGFGGNTSLDMTTTTTTIQQFKTKHIYCYTPSVHMPNGHINFSEMRRKSSLLGEAQFFLCFKKTPKTIGFVEVELWGFSEEEHLRRITLREYTTHEGDKYYNFMKQLKIYEGYDASIGGFEEANMPFNPFEKRKGFRVKLESDNQSDIYERVYMKFIEPEVMDEKIDKCIELVKTLKK